MDNEQFAKWHRLELKVRALLRRKVESSMFQLLVLPSFEPCYCWTICQHRGSSDSYVAVRSVWDAETDKAIVERPVVPPVARLKPAPPLEPTIHHQEFSLPTDWAEERLSTLKTLVIPAFIQTSRSGLDGTSYEFAFNNFFVEARYSWWEEPPAGWHPLSEWFNQTLNVLESLRVV